MVTAKTHMYKKIKFHTRKIGLGGDISLLEARGAHNCLLVQHPQRKGTGSGDGTRCTLKHSNGCSSCAR